MTHLRRLREWLLCGLLSRGHLPSPPSSTGSSCLRCGRVLVRFHESQPPALSWFEWADPLSQSEADAWVAAFEASRRGTAATDRVALVGTETASTLPSEAIYLPTAADMLAYVTRDGA